MTDDTHDMDLRAVFVDGVAQRLAVDGERHVIASVPVLVTSVAARAIELRRVDTRSEMVRMVDWHGGLRTPLRRRTSSAGKRFLAKIIDPFA